MLTLACITRGGNPPPQLIWKRGNVQVDATYTVRGHVTTNIHTFRVDATDNNGVYRCEASSNEIEEPIAASVKLSVHFPPSNVKLTGPLQAKRSDTITLTCSTEVSNPPSQITWVVDGSRVVGGESVTNKMADGWVTSSNLTITLTRQILNGCIRDLRAKRPFDLPDHAAAFFWGHNRLPFIDFFEHETTYTKEQFSSFLDKLQCILRTKRQKLTQRTSSGMMILQTTCYAQSED
ncbi:Synaptogenesis protein syg-2 [Araneus ventricosus]|uniref:Synaptogenesis protein syg-2 n=1 Tax=Araneus ventricosus TaxID=182803 RepID=A0A4Y2PSM3_ARAVE|nr:Synaptogenesis protein syg-2 [Araneus ventricosus]GBN54348.1 Synaptogenesis protein syg-2 [Araneus ventricosus]